jgi:putative tricarboxylic transport membrane protein
MKLSDSMWGLLCIALGAVVLIHVQGFPAMPGQKYGPAVFPGLIAVGFVACGLLLIMRGVKAKHALVEWMEWTHSRTHLLRFAGLVVAIIFYILASDALGFLLTGTLTLLGLFALFGVALPRAAVIAVLATLAIHFLFYKVMRVPLPWGVLTSIAW